jgi:hypothetical protein
LQSIDTVPFLDPKHFYTFAKDEHNPMAAILCNNNDNTTNRNNVVNTSNVDNSAATVTDDIKVWVYVPKHSIPPDGSHPILQSYIDIIMRGCFNTIGDDFARAFISTTTGWSAPNDIHSSYWVNDRDWPIYKRADRFYSKMNAAKIDDVLFDELDKMEEGRRTCASICTTAIGARRTIYDPVLHLEQLAQSLNSNGDDTVHPLAFQHFVSRIRNHNVLVNHTDADTHRKE